MAKGLAPGVGVLGMNVLKDYQVSFDHANRLFSIHN
jgi:hypothetical protein